MRHPLPRVAVIGLGRFGSAVARTLAARGVEVIAIDRDPAEVAAVKDEVGVAVTLDASDPAALKSQDVDRCDVAVVAIGDDFESALLAAVVCRKLECPRVICRAQTRLHAEIFRQIGADEVIEPETQAGEHLARNLASPHLADFMPLGGHVLMVEQYAPEQFCGSTLIELDLRAKYDVNLVAIKRADPEDPGGEPLVIPVPKPDDLIRHDDLLVLIGTEKALARLPRE